MLGCDVIIYAVLKLTSETKIGPLGRERVLPWYKGKGNEKGKTSNFGCAQSNSDTLWK